ncbi:hypothetical protein [Streptomyces sp. NPDC093598]|uniref:hypothetical protein n=1 Tax=Streptomyces sp. NPDC093598 TaxID=3366046 RepID=UPI00380A1928
MRAAWAACVGSLIASAAIAPQAITPSTAHAADEACTSSVGTYVLRPSGSSNAAKKRTLAKYMDWGPKGSESSFFDTEFTAQIAAASKLFTAPNGLIYEISSSDRDAPLKSYKDNTATGGALLTPVKSYKPNWAGAKRVWSNGKRIFVVSDDTVNVLEQSAPATGDGTISLIATLPRSSRLTEIITAQDVWMVGSVIYTLSTDGAIAHRTYLETKDSAGTIKPTLGATVTDKTGLSGVTQAWSPGPGVINTLSTTDDPDTTGRISKSTTDPFTTINDEVTVGVLGDVMAAPASCLADADPNIVPHFGTRRERPADRAGNNRPRHTATVEHGHGKVHAGQRTARRRPGGHRHRCRRRRRQRQCLRSEGARAEQGDHHRRRHLVGDASASPPRGCAHGHGRQPWRIEPQRHHDRDHHLRRPRPRHRRPGRRTAAPAHGPAGREQRGRDRCGGGDR